MPTRNWADIGPHVRTAMFGNTTSMAQPTAQGRVLKQIVMNLPAARARSSSRASPPTGCRTWSGAPSGTARSTASLTANVVDTRGALPVRRAGAGGRGLQPGHRWSGCPQPTPTACRRRCCADPEGERRVQGAGADDAHPGRHVRALRAGADHYRKALAKGQRWPAGASGHPRAGALRLHRGRADAVRWPTWCAGWSAAPVPATTTMFTPEIVAAPAYGCAFTDNTLGPDDLAGGARRVRPVACRSCRR